jgi:cell division protein FtsW
VTASLPLRRLRSRVIMPRLNHLDYVLLSAVVGLMGLGIVMVFNASYFAAQERFGSPTYFFSKHLFSIGVGALLLTVLSQMRLEVFERIAVPALVVSFVLLVLVLIPGIGVVRGGARRWLAFGGFSFQPAELAKISVILYLAHSITRKSERMRTLVYGVLPHLLVVGVCAGLIILQPDFGTSAIVSLTMLAMLFVGGVRSAHLGALGALFLVAVVAAVLISPYRMVRFMTFLDPWSDPRGPGFQLVQSFIAFGSGGFAGNGLGASRQKMFYLPEAHTDFILPVVGEELGFVGIVLVVALFAVVGVRGFRVAMRHPDPFGSLLAFGITASLMIAAVVNACVVLGLLPTKGLPLPFLSYGGTAMMFTLAEVGILASLSRTTG